MMASRNHGASGFRRALMHNSSTISHSDGEHQDGESLSIEELTELIDRLASDDRAVFPFRRLFRANRIVPKYILPLLFDIPDPRIEKIEKATLAIQLLANLTEPWASISPGPVLQPYCKAEIDKLVQDVMEQVHIKRVLSDLHRKISLWTSVRDDYPSARSSTFIKNYLVLCRNLLTSSAGEIPVGTRAPANDRSRLSALAAPEVRVTCKDVLSDLVHSGFLDPLLSLCLLNLQVELMLWSPILTQILLLICKGHSPILLAPLIKQAGLMQSLVTSVLPVKESTITTQVKQLVGSVSKAPKQSGESCGHQVQRTTLEETEGRERRFVAHGLRRFIELGGYNHLLSALQSHVLNDPELLDLSCLLWLIAYFAKFMSADNGLLINGFSTLLSPDTMGLLVFVAVDSFERIQSEKGSPFYQKRLQLVVKSIQNLLVVIERLADDASCADTQNFMRQVEALLCNVMDFRCLTFLLMREFDESTGDLSFLAEIMITNHHTLKLLARVASFDTDNLAVFVGKHIDQKVILSCGILLENLSQLPTAVQDALLFFMQICVQKLRCFDLIFHPRMLQTLMELWSEPGDLNANWLGLLGHLSEEFLTFAQQASYLPPSDGSDSGESSQSQSDADQRSGSGSVTDSESIGGPGSCMNSSETESSSQYSPSETGTTDESISSSSPRSIYARSVQKRRRRLALHSTNKSLEDLVTLLVDRGNQQQLQWVQRQLLDLCAIKYFSGNCPCSGISRYYAMQNQPVPLIPYGRLQNQALKSDMFLHLLQRMGIRPAAETGRIYPRIPEFWSANFLLFSARLLGQLPSNEELLFDPAQVSQEELCGSMAISVVRPKPRDHSSSSRSYP